MNPQEFLQAINDEFRSVDDDAPIAGTQEANYWLRTANRVRRTLYRDTSKQFSATWKLLDLGVITATTSPVYTFAADTEFLSASNDAYVIADDGQRHDFDIVKVQDKKANARQFYVAGQPQKVYFNAEIKEDDPIVGGHLFFPSFVMPADITPQTPTIIVDDIDWLVVATAAVLAFNDLTYEDKAPDLNGRANSMYKVLVGNNRRGNRDSDPRTQMYSKHKIRNRPGR